MKRPLLVVLPLLLVLTALGAWARYRRLTQDGAALADELETLAAETWERPSHRPLPGLVDVNGCTAAVVAHSPGEKKLIAASLKPEPTLEPELGPFLARLAHCSRGTTLAPVEGISLLLADEALSSAVQATAAWNTHAQTLLGQGNTELALDFCADTAGLTRDFARNMSPTTAVRLLEHLAPECAVAARRATSEQRARFVAELELLRRHPAPACTVARTYEASVRVWSIGGWLPDDLRARFPSGMRRTESTWSRLHPLEPFRYTTRRRALAGTMQFCGERWPSASELLAMQTDWDDTLVGGPLQAGFLVENVLDQQRILDALMLATRRFDDASAPAPAALRVFDEEGRLIIETRLTNRKFTLELPR